MPDKSDTKYTLTGRITNQQGQPLAGLIVRAYDLDPKTPPDLLGKEAVTDAEGKYTVVFTEEDFRKGAQGERGPDIFIRVYEGKSLLGESPFKRNSRENSTIDLKVDTTGKATFRVEGKVASRVSTGVGGLCVRIVAKGIGDDVRLAYDAVTNEDGTYQFAMSEADLRKLGTTSPDLQTQVYVGNKLLAGSEVRYNASNRETLNVLLDEQTSSALQSEHEVLTGTLRRQFKGKLSDLKETDDRQEITYLANKTGWDARAVALAALADQFSARNGIVSRGAGIEPAFFYALFRAGVPANEAAVYQTDMKTAENVWKQAISQGVIPAGLEKDIPNAIRQFQTSAAQHALESPALVGVSSLKEMLTLSLGDSEEARNKQARFVELYIQHQDDLSKFWEAIKGEFGEAATKRLKLDGQLAYLTINNKPLIEKLHNAKKPNNGLADAVDLVAMGYYDKGKWLDDLKAIDSKDPIPLPPEISGKDDDEKRSRYAELMAAQVRLSFPTAVVAKMVESRELPMADELRSRVHDFLMQHQGKFEIGTQPVEQYDKQNNWQKAPEVVKEVTRIQRVYQVTPSDKAMNALLNKGVDSAYAVVRYDREEFVRSFKNEVGGEAEARLIYARAQQVHNAVLNLAVSYLTARNAPGIGVHSSAQIVNPAPAPPANVNDVIAYSTLESLFGEMDYCECQHCRSILSPAAYLVDLLLFLYSDNQRWTDFLKTWKANHANAPYPFVDQAAWNKFQNEWNTQHPGQPLPNTEISPFDVLMSRRPDIQHLPLTCENTNTPLPYIDLVNETLEYYVTNGLSLANYIGNTTDGSVNKEELLANPQFVTDAAYKSLAGACFPFPLPFHQPLEKLRRYFDKFEAPLPEVMEALRVDEDDLERPNPVEYGWRDILMEELRLSRAEYALLTDRTLTLQQIYGYPPVTTDAKVMAELSNAKQFTRRVGISYEDLIEILKTRFVNPNSTLIPKLERLGVPFSTLKALNDGRITDQEFAEALAPHLDESQYGGDIRAWVKNQANYDSMMSLITLTGPTGADNVCSFDKLEFRYADPGKSAQNIRAFEFVRLIRFIRIWKKLGWTIEQTDKMITALYPANQAPDDPDNAVNLQRLDEGFLTLLPRLGIIKRVMEVLKLKPEKDLLPLLSCFAPLDTHGQASLYRRMFPAALRKQSPAFEDNGYGDFLTNAAEKLMAHAETLRAAFLLTADEFVQIAAALGYDANTPLTLDNITAVFRRGWLARKLKLSVKEFLLLTQFTDIDPFAAPDPVDPPILRFINLVNQLRAASLKPAQALYLIWNQDLSGKSAPDEGETSTFCRTLRSAFAAIESEFALTDDPNGQIARARMALVYGNEATDFFFGLLENTLVTDVSYSHGQATLEKPIVDAAFGRIAYDDFRKLLSFKGVLTTAIHNALQNVGGVTTLFQAAVNSLYKKNQKIIEPFFTRYPELLQLCNAYIDSNELVAKKRADLLANFLPELKRRRKRQQALQAISAAAKADAGFTSAVLDDKAVLHAADDKSSPALDDLMALETTGLSVQFFFADKAVGKPDLPRDAETSLAYSATGNNKLPPNGNNPANAISGIWSGYLEAPENGFYNLRIEADMGATVTLTLGDAVVALAQNGNVWSNNAPIELRAGTLYVISLKVEKIKNTLNVHWQSEGRGWEIIPARYLYSATLADHLRQVYVRFLKAASLAGALKLTAAEFSYLASHADYQIGRTGWLNSLPVVKRPGKALSKALLKVFTALLELAYLKADLSPDDERFLAVLKEPKTKTQNSDSLLLTITRWEPNSLDALLKRFKKTNNAGNADRSALKDLSTFGRVYGAYAWVKKLGVPAAALIKAATNEPDAAIVRDLQAALRARYGETDWLKVLKPINDEMRGLQRDALVAHILHQMRANPDSAHIDTPEKLFEYFLMDVQMEPCMQTSRIRHALSSVQLFIERSLMNLEPRVAPSSINAKHWEWMKRYRVWEANRKVFLYPENWLEPELRDDQSPFFKETMSELLQGDITEDRAAVALLNYLAKLDEVAKLEPCGMHYIENDPATQAQDDVAHVVARTAGANRKYYYRRREYGYWTPWEQIKLDIEDNPVIPVVWKGRLLLFWLRILKQAVASPPTVPDDPTTTLVQFTASTVIKSDVPKVTVQAVLCWSEYYNGKWQPTRTSDINQPVELGEFNATGNSSFDRSVCCLAVSEETGSNALRIEISGQGTGSWFQLFNTHSLPIRKDDLRKDDQNSRKDDQIFISFLGDNLYRVHSSRVFDVSKDDLIINYDYFCYKIIGRDPLKRAILKNRIRDRAIFPRHQLQNAWVAPFFYEDGRQVFYVSTATQLVTISKSNTYTSAVASQAANAKTPPLIQPSPQQDARRIPIFATDEGITNTAGLGVTDSSPMERFITEDAYIRRGIATSGIVRFGDKDIGPAGSIVKTAQKR